VLKWKCCSLPKSLPLACVSEKHFLPPLFTFQPSACQADPASTPIGTEGRKPVEIQVATDQRERQAVEDILKHLLKVEKVPATSIVILTLKAQTKSQWHEGEKLAGHALSWRTPSPNNAIACATIHSFKGLESPVVILTEMAEPDTARVRQLSYVACSRAKSHLVLVRRV
jgi:superfamily I DNA/RNA helicase